jgi:hypothetical protein
VEVTDVKKQNVVRHRGTVLVDTSPEKTLRSLIQASGKQRQDEIPEANLYRTIGFEGTNARLGWVIPPDWHDVERTLTAFLRLSVVRGKNHFIFSSMGGSINTVKALIHILGDQSRIQLHTIDSLDPPALRGMLSSIPDLSRAAVIGITKSGTTIETHLLLKALQERFQAQKLDHRGHFLWLTDVPHGKQHVEEAGWNSPILPIQVDKGTDVGGRFTAPHTAIFHLPLLLLLNKKVDHMKPLWKEYICLREDLIVESARKAYISARKGTQHFAVVLEETLIPALETWVIQLFQESLGSKIAGFHPKTVVTSSEAVPEGFQTLRFDVPSSSIIVQTMLQMHLLQIYLAIIAYHKGINFVTQAEIEAYKQKMTEVHPQKTPQAEIVTPSTLIERIRTTIYWHLKEGQRRNMKHTLKTAFPDNEISVFAGTDWNHHSYQAASWNDDTLFTIVTKQNYEHQIEGISTQTLNKNLDTLRAIAYATYETLQNKAILLIWSNQKSTISTSVIQSNCPSHSFQS